MRPLMILPLLVACKGQPEANGPVEPFVDDVLSYCDAEGLFKEDQCGTGACDTGADALWREGLKLALADALSLSAAEVDANFQVRQVRHPNPGSTVLEFLEVRGWIAAESIAHGYLDTDPTSAEQARDALVLYPTLPLEPPRSAQDLAEALHACNVQHDANLEQAETLGWCSMSLSLEDPDVWAFRFEETLPSPKDHDRILQAYIHPWSAELDSCEVTLW